MLRNKLFLGTAVAAAMLLSACDIFDGELSDEKLQEVCKDYCPEPEPTTYIITDSKWDDEAGGFISVPGSVGIESADGQWIHVLNKSADLRAECFSAEPINSSGVRKLDDLELTWTNTTILLLNFTENGRLESRELKEDNGTTNGGVLYDTLDQWLDTNQQWNNSNPTPEHEAIRNALTEFSRPDWNSLDPSGVSKRDIRNVSDEKTPFFQKLRHGVKDHVFFYVLLDDYLKFNRTSAAMLPYTPMLNNGSVGQLYSPYIQYPIVPELDLSATPQKIKDVSKTEVLTVHFLRENMAMGIPQEGPLSTCSYPYDIGVVAEGQEGPKGPSTPTKLDPETEADGPPD